MAHSANDLPPLVRELAPDVPAATTDHLQAADARLAAPTPEQVRAADGVFTARKEQDKGGDIMALWSSALVLHDLAVEAFQPPEEDDERKHISTDEDEPERE